MTGEVVSQIWDKSRDAALAEASGTRPFIIQRDEGGEVKLISTEEFQERPSRVRESLFLTEVKSFVEYVNHFKGAGTILLANFSDKAAPKIEAVIDGHDPMNGPGWGSHKVTLAPKLHSDFLHLRKLFTDSREPYTMADTLEEVAHLVVIPDGATILEMLRDFRASKNVKYEAKHNPKNGSFAMVFKDDTDQLGQHKFPELVTFVVPLFEGQEPQTFEASLRFHLTERTALVKFWCKGFDELFREDLQMIREKIESATGISVLL